MSVRRVGVFAAIVMLIIVLMSVFLAPDDLSKCNDRPSDQHGCEMANAIVAVSGGDTTARTQRAIQLYKHGWAPVLVFSGAAQDKSGPSNAEVMRSIALANGVPAQDIIIEESSETTSQNAEKTRGIFRDKNIHSVILVTSAYHQRRASIEFSSRIADISLRNSPVSRDNQWSGWWWLTPIGWYLASTELIKIVIIAVQDLI